MKYKRSLTLIAATAVAGLVMTGCSDPTEVGDGNAEGDNTIVISSANFVESEIIGNLFAETLRDAGIEVEEKFNIGARETYIPALQDGSIDLVPDYTGNLLLYLDSEADISQDADIVGALDAQLDEVGLKMLEPSEAEDTDTVTVSKETAEKWNLKSIADLKPHNDELILGGMPEFNERDRGIPGLTELYGVKPAKFVPISDGGGPATVEAVLDGTVHGANIFTTTPAIEEHDLVVLEDPKGNFPQQFIAPVINQDKLTPEIEAALKKVTDKLTTEEVIKLNTMVSGDEKLEPKDAANTWLKEQGVIS